MDFKTSVQEWGRAEHAFAGVPLYFKGDYLVLAKAYPKKLQAFYAVMNEKYFLSKRGKKDKLRNVWFSRSKNQWVYIRESPEGKIYKEIDNGTEERFKLFRYSSDFTTGLNNYEAEVIALEKLKSLVSKSVYQEYFVTGSFYETSKKSDVCYCFRRSRPTIAFRNFSPPKILACLCCHAVGYYLGSFSGVLAPTDDVVSHLLMMRTDEKMFWKKSTQHQPYSPLAGI